MWAHCIYLHRKADSGEPFYVGKCKLRKGRKDRAYDKASRNLIWQRTVAKHGLIVEIIASCFDDLAAQKAEKNIIALLGRRNLGAGPLVNLTDGGDGHAGIIVSEELRQKRRINSSGRRSEAFKKAVRAARKNGGNGGVVKRGDKLPDWWRVRISKSVRGANNVMFGRTGEKHPNRRAVVDANGGEFPTVTAAAAHLGMRMQTLHNMLTGFRPNNTTMRFA